MQTAYGTTDFIRWHSSSSSYKSVKDNGDYICMQDDDANFIQYDPVTNTFATSSPETRYILCEENVGEYGNCTQLFKILFACLTQLFGQCILIQVDVELHTSIDECLIYPAVHLLITRSGVFCSSRFACN